MVLMGSSLKRITFLWLTLALGLGGCAGVSPVGGPSNPAGIADKSNSDSTSSTDDTLIPSGINNGIDTGAPSAGGSPSGPGAGDTPLSSPLPNGGGGIPTNTSGSSVAMANGGSTFCPKGDNEKMGDDLLKEATDWRLRFGVNAWWELSKTTPEPFPVFKNTTTDFQMKLEALLPNCGWVLVFGPNVHAVYQPKGQAPQTFDAAAEPAGPEGYNVQFLGLNLGEGTVTFSADSSGTQHPLGSLATYLAIDPSQMMAPTFNQTVK